MSAFLYVLRCNGGKYYVGSTEDLERRMKEHAAGRGCAFTKAHLPFELVYTEEHPSYESAYERERQVHKWSRAKKERLIKGELNLGSRGTRMTTTVETRVCELQSGSRAESRDNSDNTRRLNVEETKAKIASRSLRNSKGEYIQNELKGIGNIAR